LANLDGEDEGLSNGRLRDAGCERTCCNGELAEGREGDAVAGVWGVRVIGVRVGVWDWSGFSGVGGTEFGFYSQHSHN
jgi:hypothetical protein